MTVTDAGPFEPDLSLWDAWTPAEVARRLAGVTAPWYIAGGWAIDLFLGGQYREHEDIEVGVPFNRFAEVAAVLAGFEFFVPVSGPGNGLVWPLDQADDNVEDHHQTWVREPATGQWRMDIFREPSDGDTWISRRDARIRLPYQDLIEHTSDGIPYCRPEVALLFKAKYPELPKNQRDFDAALPRLGPERRQWLRESIALLHPGHPWLDRLGD
jgi:hypothetical protein